ncbi:unnamed protein product [Urochloa humidicola]
MGAASEMRLGEPTCCAASAIPRRQLRAGLGGACPTTRRQLRAGPGRWEARRQRTMTTAVGFEAAGVRSVAGVAAGPKNPSWCKEPSGRGKSQGMNIRDQKWKGREASDSALIVLPVLLEENTVTSPFSVWHLYWICFEVALFVCTDFWFVCEQGVDELREGELRSRVGVEGGRMQVIVNPCLL